MTKINEEMLQFFVNKYLGYMTQDAQKQVEVTDKGFVYKGELIVSIPGLRDTLIVKEPVTVGELKTKKAAESEKVVEIKTVKLDPRKVDVSKEEPVKSPVVLQEMPEKEPVVAEEPVKEEAEQKYPGKRRGPKPKNKS